MGGSSIATERTTLGFAGCFFVPCSLALPLAVRPIFRQQERNGALSTSFSTPEMAVIVSRRGNLCDILKHPAVPPILMDGLQDEAAHGPS